VHGTNTLIIVTVGYKEVFRRQTVTTLQYIKTKHLNITIFT